MRHHSFISGRAYITNYNHIYRVRPSSGQPLEIDYRRSIVLFVTSLSIFSALLSLPSPKRSPSFHQVRLRFGERTNHNDHPVLCRRRDRFARRRTSSNKCSTALLSDFFESSSPRAYVTPEQVVVQYDGLSVTACRYVFGAHYNARAIVFTDGNFPHGTFPNGTRWRTLLAAAAWDNTEFRV